MHSSTAHRASRLRWRGMLRAVPPVFWVFMLMLLGSVPLLGVHSRAGGMSWAFLSNMLERSVTLGIVAVGQTFAILRRLDRPLRCDPHLGRGSARVLHDAGESGDDPARRAADLSCSAMGSRSGWSTASW